MVKLSEFYIDNLAIATFTPVKLLPITTLLKKLYFFLLTRFVMTLAFFLEMQVIALFFHLKFMGSINFLVKLVSKYITAV